MASRDTRAVHAGRDDLRELGVHAAPIDLSTTYPVKGLREACESIDAMMEGEEPGANPIYSRLHNPTVARFEAALADLEGAEAAVAYASGMAALTGLLLAASERGSHVVAVRPMYGGSDMLLSSGLLGTEVTWARADEVRDAIGPQTALVMIETPANPTLEVVDIQKVAAQTGDVPLVVDSTFATPILQRPIEQGADLVLHSATKFLGGHGDVLGGVIATGEALARELRCVRSLTGAVLHPQAAYTLHRGLQTLSVRVARAQRTARTLAGRLYEHPAIDRVHYPGFFEGRAGGIVERQMEGAGAIVSFDLAAGFDKAIEVMSAVELITPAVSLGSVDTLIQHPAGLTHRKVDPEVRRELGIGDGMMRLSVGLEDADDLWRDLLAALDGE
ncbi:MAG: trans-sulfuration enzyme family protein [Persicimonas sp.]